MVREGEALTRVSRLDPKMDEAHHVAANADRKVDPGEPRRAMRARAVAHAIQALTFEAAEPLMDGLPVDAARTSTDGAPPSVNSVSGTYN